jgi:hypothetical protein
VAVSEITHDRVTNDSLAVTFGSSTTMNTVEGALQDLRRRVSEEMRPAVAAEAVDGLKFAESLPRGLAINLLQNRLADTAGLHHMLAQPVRFVGGGPPAIAPPSPP